MADLGNVWDKLVIWATWYGANMEFPMYLRVVKTCWVSLAHLSRCSHAWIIEK